MSQKLLCKIRRAGCVLLLCLPGFAQAGSLTIRFTAPTQNNLEPDCSKPAALVPATDQIWVHTVIPSLGVHDSLWCFRGTVINHSYTAPAGSFPVTVYAARLASGALRYGCPTTKNFTVAADSLPAAPAAPAFK